MARLPVPTLEQRSSFLVKQLQFLEKSGLANDLDLHYAPAYERFLVRKTLHADFEAWPREKGEKISNICFFLDLFGFVSRL